MDPAPLDPITNEQAVERTELMSALPPDSLGLVDQAQTVARARFASLFDEEIQVVTAARNPVAHARPIDDAVLDEALELARELVRIIHEGQELIATSFSDA